MIDKYTYIIVVLLPLSALMLVFQTNPYHALVIRGVMGAIAVLVYAILGAADVALTEALVGTMLAVTLYVIAVRSSLVMRLGILKKDGEMGRREDEEKNNLTELITSLRKIINQHHLRLELVQYPSLKDLEQALQTKEVHAIFTSQDLATQNPNNPIEIEIKQTYHTAIRVRRLFEILQSELIPATTITYVNIPNTEDEH